MKAFFDIETGGFSITKNGVCEIGLIVIDDNYNYIDTFYSLIKPYKREDSDELVSYKDDAMAINGLTVEQLERDGEEIIIVLLDLINALKSNNVTEIIGHNSKVFDTPRIDYLLTRFLKCDLSFLKQEDTMEIAKLKLKLPSYSLESLCKHFGIVNEKQHSALGDVMATIELYKQLMKL